MKPSITRILFSTLIIFAIPVHANDYESHKDQIAQAENLILNFQSALKSELKKAIEEGGAEKAIVVCNEQAPLIAQTLSTLEGVSIGRTALRVRNQNNLPDAWESEILNKFNKQKEEGSTPEEMIAYKEDGSFRYMKAISMQPMCAMCHGEHIDEGLYAKIKKIYPHDTAINYKLDDIRGAFVVSLPKKSTPQ
ncbi:MAG: hypothetical protein AUJ12_01865 [Alphaproteobacteria bacterium CG1_02_46_17]|nr:MAG: hypothetical protein AUJ12_01865 [Alphaproteobacteria bacterium CG1_02_46_17]